MPIPGGKHLKRLVLETIGWILIVVGIAALVLPGPGLLLLASGLVILANEYEWARKRVAPVREQAIKAAREGVRTIPRIIGSFIGCTILLGFALFWGFSPPAPGWWPIDEKWWLPGGWATASSLILSAAIAYGTLIYSIKRFRKEEREGAAAQASVSFAGRSRPATDDQ